MPTIMVAISLHVVAGLVWMLTTIWIAVSGSARKELLGLQIGAALVAILDGIGLWHALHAGRNGSTEHWLAAGTFCALIAIGPQLAIAGPALVRPAAQPMTGGALMLMRATAILLVLAAIAMAASRWS